MLGLYVHNPETGQKFLRLANVGGGKPTYLIGTRGTQIHVAELSSNATNPSWLPCNVFKVKSSTMLKVLLMWAQKHKMIENNLDGLGVKFSATDCEIISISWLFNVSINKWPEGINAYLDGGRELGTLYLSLHNFETEYRLGVQIPINITDDFIKFFIKTYSEIACIKSTKKKQNKKVEQSPKAITPGAEWEQGVQSTSKTNYVDEELDIFGDVKDFAIVYSDTGYLPKGFPKWELSYRSKGNYQFLGNYTTEAEAKKTVSNIRIGVPPTLQYVVTGTCIRFFLKSGLEVFPVDADQYGDRVVAVLSPHVGFSKDFGNALVVEKWELVDGFYCVTATVYDSKQLRRVLDEYGYKLAKTDDTILPPSDPSELSKVLEVSAK